MMETKIEQRGAIAVVAVAGSIDAATAPALGRTLVAQIDAGHIHLIADLGGVDYTSSAGLRALLASLKHSRSCGGDFRLAGIRKEVLRVLDMSGFTSILKIYADVDEAVASFS
jgi:anti-anti-sigma factor